MVDSNQSKLKKPPTRPVQSSSAQTPIASSDKSQQVQTESPNSSTIINSIQPEQMSLDAYEQIQNYLKSQDQGKNLMSKEDLNAILRLSTHLRVYGLLSAVGYINQENEQDGEVRKRTVPIWKSLLGQLVMNNNTINKKELMELVQKMAQNNPTQYMQMWKKALKISHYWNFWGRAYKKEKKDS